MRYLVLLYGDEAAGGSPAELAAEWAVYEAEMAVSGRLVTWAGLERTASGKRLRLEEGAASVRDGPFAETKEQLGGFYLLDCADMEEALACAARMPCAGVGYVEVRPLLSGLGQEAGVAEVRHAG